MTVLPTLAATITSTGVTAPTYPQIYASLQESFSIIYGSDSYLDPDSDDGEMLAIFAQGISDCNSATIAVYNAYSPSTAQGAGLSSVVKINGLARETASNSTSDVTIIGQAGTIITNGIVGDGTFQWALPASVTIPIGGSIIETATCTTLGAVTAAAATITNIVTPTLGWQTVNNPADAVPGAPVETDAQLRQRQSVSTEIAAESIIGAIYAALANLPGVQQLKIYENDTKTTDANTLPANSIAVVIEGGDAVSIATAIEQKKTPGTNTYGTTSEIIIDPVGVPVTISFFVPTQVLILVHITIKALSGYLSSTGAQVIQNLVDFINAEGINANDGLLSLSSLYSPAYNTGALANTYNVTALLISRSPASPGSSDLTIAFNELPVIAASNVTLTVT